MSSADSGLSIEAIYAAVRKLQHEHPRSFLLLCHADDQEKIFAGIKMMNLDPDEVLVEVRSHSYVKEGHCFLMRHPNDFEWRPRFEVGAPAGEETPTTG